jgi:uncharacterized membrane protein YccC
VSKTLNADCRYLDAILVQYHQGKDNSLPYRTARRDAHNSDADLASVVSNMSADPKTDPTMQETAFRLLCLNHTLLSYISALGAHRELLGNSAVLDLLNDAVCYVDGALHQEEQDNQRIHQALEALAERIRQLVPEPESKEQLVLQQIGLVIELLPELTALNKQISRIN